MKNNNKSSFHPHFTDSTLNGRNDLKTLSVEDWLTSLCLQIYVKNFVDNLFTSMDKVLDIWDDELTSILEIEKLGHRKRILLSLAGTEGIPNRFGKVKVPLVSLCFILQLLKLERFITGVIVCKSNFAY